MRGVLAIKGKTASDLAEALGARLYQNSVHVPYVETLIRWGHTGGQVDSDQELNSAEAISKSSNKPLCRQILQEAGVSVPLPANGYLPCIGRRAKHTRGRGYFFCTTSHDIERAKRKGCAYFSQFYPKTKEFRVHIGGKKVILISEKIKDIKNVQKPWNKKEGFLFRHLGRSEWDIEIVRLAKKAIEAVGLDFGAVDIGACPSDPSFPYAVVFEINTAPALTPYGIQKYCEYFNRVLGIPEEFEYEEPQFFPSPFFKTRFY